MAVRKAGLGRGLDSLIPEHSIRKKPENNEQKRHGFDIIMQQLNPIGNSREKILMKMHCWNYQNP